MVTFAAYRVPSVVQALESAVNRGVRIDFVAEAAEESGGKVTFNAVDALGESIVQSCNIYHWPIARREKSPDGRHGSLHAKCAVADSHMLLVSSANLTDYAFNLNMELGLLVQGGSLPGRVREVFEHLVHTEELVRA